MRTKPLLLPWAGIVLLGITLIGKAETVSLQASADATLFEVNPNNSAGGDGFFNAGTTQNRTRNRALLLFDIGSAIPLGAQITGVTLELEVTRRPIDGFEASLFGLHRVLRPWGEGTTIVEDNGGGLGAPAAPGDATWLHRFAFSQPWGAPGGLADVDYRAEFSGSTFIYDVDLYQFEGTSDMIADVQSWVDNPGTNFGWMLKTESEELPFTARRFASREDLNGGGPRLIVDFVVVPEPGTMLLFAVGLLLLALHCWRRKNPSCAGNGGQDARRSFLSRGDRL